MLALPALAGDTPQPTGLVCPDCPGVLGVEAHGQNGHLHFRCRIGHAFAVPELLTAKEQAIEERLWGAVLALEEMAALLRDLEAHAARECGVEVGRACQERQEVVEAQARTVRALIQADRPLDLSRAVPGAPEPAALESPT
jgi:two-component system chemotaxis response regulator CheB